MNSIRQLALGVALGIAVGSVPSRLLAPPVAAAEQTNIPQRMGMSELERLIELEQRMANVERELANRKSNPVIKAPFRVLDSLNRPIFEVLAANGAYVATLNDPAGSSAVVMRSGSNGNNLELDSGGKTVATVSVNGGAGNLQLYAGDSTVVQLGRTYSGGALRLFNGNTEIGYFGSSERGGGRLALADPAGGKTVDAGWNGAFGEVCAATKTGPHCLGVGLPLR
jgi:hypothetical protein